MHPRCLFLLLGLVGLIPSEAMGREKGRETPAATAQSAVARRALNLEELSAALKPDGALKARIDRLEATIPRGDSTEFDSFLKADWLLDAIMRPVHGQQEVSAPEIEDAFAQGTRASWTSRSLSNDYLGHQFRFLRVHTLGGRPGLLFRSAGENGQLNYCMFSVATGPAGVLNADDVYVVGMGEWLSDTLRRGYLTLVESLSPRGESGRRANLYVEALPQITAMQTALIRKEYPRVIALSSLLPPEVLQDRQILLTRLEAAEHVSMLERSRVFAEWKSLHPKPEQLPLKWADFHIAAGQFDDARAVLAALNDRLGGDSHLMLRLGEIKMLAAHHAAGRSLGGRPKSANEPSGRAESGR